MECETLACVKVKCLVFIDICYGQKNIHHFGRNNLLTTEVF